MESALICFRKACRHQFLLPSTNYRGVILVKAIKSNEMERLKSGPYIPAPLHSQWYPGLPPGTSCLPLIVDLPQAPWGQRGCRGDHWSTGLAHRCLSHLSSSTSSSLGSSLGFLSTVTEENDHDWSFTAKQRKEKNAADVLKLLA